GMLPSGLRERFSSRDGAYLGVEGDEWLAYRPVAGRLAQAGRVTLGSLDAAGRRNAFRRLRADLPGAARSVWLVLPPEAALVREVHMPLAAEEALRDAIGFDLDRLTPLPAARAWFDYRVTGRDAAAQRLALTLAVTQRAPVEARLAEIRELGAAVLGVGLMDDVAASPTPLNLLPMEERDRPAVSGSTLAARILAAAAAVLAIAALVYPLWLKREAVIALHPRLDKARAGADVAERLGKEIEKLAAEHNFVLGKKHAQVPVVTLMEELSRLLPDTTWVQQLDVKSGAKSREIQLAGETGSSSQLIEVLERSGTFANASFKSPLTKGVTPGTERFLLVAEVKPRPLPDPVPEDALAATAAAKARPAAPPPAPAPATAIVTPVPTPAQGSGAPSAPPVAKPAAAGAPEEKD
ncbi:MAG TPA: PilN domain-containing protein, partial [Usitatibacteraceae bacterium]|nr:PilN domain-containing protein [Usitatibacteraceae bacterium]